MISFVLACDVRCYCLNMQWLQLTSSTLHCLYDVRCKQRQCAANLRHMTRVTLVLWCCYTIAHVTLLGSSMLVGRLVGVVTRATKLSHRLLYLLVSKLVNLLVNLYICKYNGNFAYPMPFHSIEYWLLVRDNIFIRIRRWRNGDLFSLAK